MPRSPNKSISHLKQYPSGTVGDWIRSLQRPDGSQECPFWPPDLFVIVGSLLRRTGVYRQAFQTAETSPRTRRQTPGTGRWDRARLAGEQWRQNLDLALGNPTAAPDLRAQIPADVAQWWKELYKAANLELGRFARSGAPDIRFGSKRHVGLSQLDPVHAAICLVIASDEACTGVGMAGRGAKGLQAKPFLSALSTVLEGPEQDFRTLCVAVLPDLVAVLPKQHTPQVGLTFRSMSHHLALIPAGEIRARWYEQRPKSDTKVYNLLLLPWPLETHSNDFAAVESNENGGGPQLFEYRPRNPADPRQVSRWVGRAIRKANRIGGPINVVILPESALSLSEYQHVEQVATREGVMLISGVRLTASEMGVGGSINACVTQTRGFLRAGRVSSSVLKLSRFWQSKHHRWCLSRTQILSYGLGNRLSATGKLWENITLPDRELYFLSIGSWMTWCALICEDLARQEPAAEVVRAVGPNLVIALLMDGPQLIKRWPARYATGLAEDPGSSVLTFTNLGLTKRSRALTDLNAENFQPNRTIALWRDACSEPQEILIGPSDTACILSLACHSQEEFTADGRGDGGQAHHPIYAGHRGFSVNP
jgi:hypothetical protein